MLRVKSVPRQNEIELQRQKNGRRGEQIKDVQAAPHSPLAPTQLAGNKSDQIAKYVDCCAAQPMSEMGRGCVKTAPNDMIPR